MVVSVLTFRLRSRLSFVALLAIACADVLCSESKSGGPPPGGPVIDDGLKPDRARAPGTMQESGRPQLRNVTLEMDDRTKLEAVYAIPTEPAPDRGYPGLVQTLGWGSSLTRSTMDFAVGGAKGGHVSIVYICRGQGRSGGFSTMMGEREWKDMRAVISWMISNLPVNAERVAVRGGSQGGIHSWMAAATDPRVRAICPSVSPFNMWEAFFKNGTMTAMSIGVFDPKRARSDGLLEKLTDDVLSGNLEPVRQELERRAITQYLNGIHCPVFSLSAWQDALFAPDFEVAAFNALGVPKKLYIGTGGHRTPQSPTEAEWRARKQAEWLAYWLEGEENGILEEKPITLALSPDWQHFEFDEFPAPAATPQWHLLPGGSLSLEPTERSGTLTLDNAMTRAQCSLRELHEEFYVSPSEGFSRDGVQSVVPVAKHSFRTPPLKEEVIAIGNPSVQLVVTRRSRSYQVVALLKDVSPSGEEFLVSRMAQAERNIAHTGVASSLLIKSRLIGHKFQKGHQIKLDIMNYDAGEVADADMHLPMLENYQLGISLGGAKGSVLRLEVHQPQ